MDPNPVKSATRLHTRTRVASRFTCCALLTSALALFGCASQPQEPCMTLNCLLADAAKPLVDQCIDDLFRHDRMSRREKKRINQTYGYPLTSNSSYLAIMGSGVNVPSPQQWCQAYGQRLARPRFAQAR